MNSTKRRYFVFFAAVALAIPLIVFAGAPSGTIKIKNFGSKKAVSFSHSLHKSKGVKCATCHHKGIKKCSSCHKDKKAMKKIAHKKCRGCHKTKAGPTRCSGCHK